ncbi:hypothetical protein NDU88_008084 [Pleurodeles waltl]|uniref:Uncharacterized protein n=1 Tax=Pleurodeles waltl TaxID=8319 RepID=A0AAV7U227_PLEWA|nr:hypothetical protein NDU88_008084 [Pleurodeles waltl]
MKRCSFLWRGSHPPPVLRRVYPGQGGRVRGGPGKRRVQGGVGRAESVRPERSHRVEEEEEERGCVRSHGDGIFWGN